MFGGTASSAEVKGNSRWTRFLDHRWKSMVRRLNCQTIHHMIVSGKQRRTEVGGSDWGFVDLEVVGARARRRC